MLLVEDGRIVDASEGAARLLANAGGGDTAPGPAARGAGGPPGPLLDRAAREVLRGFLDDRGGAALDSLARLEEAGEPFETITADRAGNPFVLTGHPRGGQLRLELRDATLIRADPKRSGGSRRTDDPPTGDSPGIRRDEPGAAALARLLAEAPVVAWSRKADGSIGWSAGQVPSRHGTVAASAVAELAARRRSRSEGMAQGAAADAQRGEPRPEASATQAFERFRLEMKPDPGGLVALEAIEVPAGDGGVHGMAVDAAGALEAERTLARFVRTMTETFAHLNVELGIFDRNQRLALFNPALVEMWQADPAWLARRPSLREILDRLRANRRIPEVADFHAWRTRLTGLFENTEAVDYDELWHLADGADIRVLARPHPHGSLAFVFEDVTERLRLEQQYRHSIDLRRATLNRLEEGLAVFGPDRLLQFVNAAFHDIWGTDGETVRPMMDVRDLVPLIGGMTVETSVWDRLVAFVTGAGSRQPWEIRLTLGTGRILGARVAGLPDGSTMAVFGDVTDSERIAGALRERNEALEAAEEMREAVLDQISHRLRTPLHSIFGFGQLLADPRFGPLTDTQRDYAQQILDSARQLLGADDDVTELAALEIEPRHDEDAEFALSDMLVSTVRLLEKRAIQEGVTLTVSLPEAELRPACEPARLRQIIFGLSTAAIGSCREGGEVELGARGTAEAVELVIALGARDRAASGAPPAECPSLPFIRRLIEQVGGAIDISSAAGTRQVRVRCSLPRAGDAAAPEPGLASGRG